MVALVNVEYRWYSTPRGSGTRCVIFVNLKVIFRISVNDCRPRPSIYLFYPPPPIYLFYPQARIFSSKNFRDTVSITEVRIKKNYFQNFDNWSKERNGSVCSDGEVFYFGIFRWGRVFSALCDHIMAFKLFDLFFFSLQQL